MRLTSRMAVAVAALAGWFGASAAPGAQVAIDGTVLENVGPLDMIKVIPGATVYLQRQFPAIWRDDTSVFRPYIPQPYVTLDSAVTTAQGTYSFAKVDTGFLRLSVSSVGYQQYYEDFLGRQDTTVNMWLLPSQASGSVSGVVTEACPSGLYCLWSPPVPGCTVEVAFSRLLCLGPMKALETMAPVPTLRAVTDDQGRFSIDSVPIYQKLACDAVQYYLNVTKAGFDRGWVGFEPQVRMTVTANVELARALAVSRGQSAATHGALGVRLVRGALEIAATPGGATRVDIATLRGQTVRSSTFEGGGQARKVSLEGLGEGWYVARVRAGAGTRTVRFQITHSL